MSLHSVTTKLPYTHSEITTTTSSTTQSTPPKISKNVIKKNSKLLQKIQTSDKPLNDKLNSMVDRVRKLSKDGVLRVAETLCALAGKLGWTNEILFKKLPQGVLSMPSPQDCVVSDEELICNTHNLIQTLDTFTINFKDLKGQVVNELTRLSNKEDRSTFIQSLIDYQTNYLVHMLEINKIIGICNQLRLKLNVRSNKDLKEDRENLGKYSLNSFSLCYSLNDNDIFKKITSMHKRSDEIAKLIPKLEESYENMEIAIIAFKYKYNFLAHLLVKEIDYHPSDTQILENFNKIRPSYIDQPMDHSCLNK